MHVVRGVRGHIELHRTTKLLLNDQRLLQQFEAASEEAVLQFKIVLLGQFIFERLVDDKQVWVIVNILRDEA